MPKTSIIALAAFSFFLQAAPPKGWYLAGSKPAEYDSGVDPQAPLNARPSAYLKAKKPSVDGFGTLMQRFSSREYAGKRVRFSGFVKSEGIQDWAGLWMRVDGGSGQGSKALAFDNMQDRPIKGTTGWQPYEVVLDVPEGATNVALGILLTGSGAVWLNSTNVEIVGATVAVTGKNLSEPAGPTNLDFTK